MENLIPTGKFEDKSDRSKRRITYLVCWSKWMSEQGLWTRHIKKRRTKYIQDEEKDGEWDEKITVNLTNVSRNLGKCVGIFFLY